MCGVLDKSLPSEMNLYQHQWMLDEIVKVVKACNGKKILDAGCGYGRISKELISIFPRLKVGGVDLCQEYVKMYNRDLLPKAKAVCGSLEKLPFDNSTFDVTIVVAALMYLQGNQQCQAMMEIARVTRPGGRIVIIEPTILSKFFFYLGKLWKFSKSDKSETKTTVYQIGKIKKLMFRSKIKLNDFSGIPIFSMSVPFLFVASRLKFKLSCQLFKIIYFLDQIFKKVTFLSIFVSYVSTNEKNK
jgi:ubiquinone/menaquinone biosynthesis C-methylase UbiE